jgi:membrane protein YqaA with SNARE-associated domain
VKILLEKLFKWVEHFANTKYKLHALFWVAFTESSFFIVPPDVLIAPIALYKKYSARFLAVFTGVASTLGGIFGYGIGYFFFHTIGVSIINFYDAWDVFEKVKHLYESSTFLTVLVAASRKDTGVKALTDDMTLLPKKVLSNVNTLLKGLE